MIIILVKLKNIFTSFHVGKHPPFIGLLLNWASSDGIPWTLIFTSVFISYPLSGAGKYCALIIFMFNVSYGF